MTLVFRVGGIPVLFVFPQPNPVAHVPKVERVRATDREGFTEAPLVAVLLDGFLRHNSERPERAQLEEKRGWAGQFDSDGLWVDGLGTELGEVGDFATVNRLGVFDVKKHAGIVAGSERVHGALPRVDNIGGRDRLTGGPAEILPQVKRVDRAVIRDIPARGQGGLGLRGDGVETGETLEHRRDDSAIRLTGDDGRIERLGVGAVDDDEVCLVVPLKTARLAKQ